MKVAMLGWEFPPFMAGGLGVHCLEITAGLAKLGVDIDFYMPRVHTPEGPVDVAPQHKHLRVKEVDADSGLDPYGRMVETYDTDFDRSVMRYNQRLLDVFSSHDADVIHCHDWLTVPAAVELRRRTGIPMVFTVHSTEFDRSAGIAPQSWIEEIEQDGIDGADRVIAVSEYTKGLLQRLYGADPEKVVAIHNGIEPGRFRRPRKYDPEGGTVLFLARLSRQKGPLYFLQVAKRVLEHRPQALFVVAGQGEMLAECIDYTIENGIADRVRFVGFVPDDELAAFYQQHDVYVLPSVSEPFGISVLEAMATGMPTIVTETSGVIEGLSHALTAPYWDVDEMADMILSLLRSPELRESMGVEGGREIERFTWRASAMATLATYQETIARQQRVMT